MDAENGTPAQTLYEAIGGAPAIAALVDAFYRRVAEHPDLKPMFPDDFTEVRKKQFAFLTQFCGGPPLFLQQYGPPRLRKRHFEHKITLRRAQSWLDCMAQALDEAGITGPARDFFYARLTAAALQMVNSE